MVMYCDYPTRDKMESRKAFVLDYDNEGRKMVLYREPAALLKRRKAET